MSERKLCGDCSTVIHIDGDGRRFDDEGMIREHVCDIYIVRVGFSPSGFNGTVVGPGIDQAVNATREYLLSGAAQVQITRDRSPAPAGTGP